MSKYIALKEKVLKANKDLVKAGLVILTWGNASEIDRENGVIAIKPSGVSYEKMEAKDIVITDLEGKVIEGTLNPSSDLKSHLALYKDAAARPLQGAVRPQAEPHHDGAHGRNDYLHAAYTDRRLVRNELPLYARTRMALGIPRDHNPQHRDRGREPPVLQEEEMVVK